MQITVMTLLQIMVLVTAISIDAFGAGFAYGIGRIKMPLLSVGIVSVVSALMLLCSIGAGKVLGKYLSGNFTVEAGFMILFVLGVVKLFKCPGEKEAKEADRDGDHILSAGEAVSLGIALSLDSIAAGIGVGVDAARMLGAVPAALITNFFMMWLGGRLGRALSGRMRTDMGWVSGVMLILLAFLRLM